MECTAKLHCNSYEHAPGTHAMSKCHVTIITPPCISSQRKNTQTPLWVKTVASLCTSFQLLSKLCLSCHLVTECFFGDRKTLDRCSRIKTNQKQNKNSSISILGVRKICQHLWQRIQEHFVFSFQDIIQESIALSANLALNVLNFASCALLSQFTIFLFEPVQ